MHLKKYGMDKRDSYATMCGDNTLFVKDPTDRCLSVKPRLRIRNKIPSFISEAHFKTIFSVEIKRAEGVSLFNVAN